MTLIQEEQFSDIWDELMPLLQDHYHEVAMYQDKIGLNVDKEFYEQGQATGKVLLLVARCTDDQSPNYSDIIGYSVTFISHNPHYSDHVYGINDVIFVHPDYRGSGGVAHQLIHTTESECMKRDVSVMTYHMKEYALFEKLMDSTGFEQMERLYAKYIGK